MFGIPRTTTASFVRRSPLSVVSTISLEEVKGKPTTECCRRGKNWYFRDENLDLVLGSHQPDASRCSVSACEKGTHSTLEEIVRSLPNAPRGTNVIELGRWAVQNGHAFTLPQLEVLIERAKRRQNTGLRIDGHRGNFCIVVPQSLETPVPVVRLGRAGNAWGIGVGGLSDTYASPRCRFLIRNLDLEAVTLR